LPPKIFTKGSQKFLVRNFGKKIVTNPGKNHGGKEKGQNTKNEIETFSQEIQQHK
jgi:hypothetical protein